MAYSYPSLLLQRIILPIILVLSALFRPVGISFVYLLMFFVSPFIPVATRHNFKGSVTAFLVILIAQSTLLILCHIALQVVIAALKLNDLFGNCSFTEQLLRHVGFVDFRNLHAVAVIEWLAPEVVVFTTALLVYLATKRFVTRIPGPNEMENGESEISDSHQGQSETSKISDEPQNRTKRFLPIEPNFAGLIKISPLFCMASLFFAAVLRPSVPGGIYFLVFLLTGTYWATMRRLGRGFTLLLRLLMIAIILHLLCIVAYQMPWMQQHLDKNALTARLIGLEALVKSSCDDNNDIRIFIYDTNTYKLSSYFNPLALFVAFYVLSLSAKNFSKGPPVSIHRENEQRPMITEPTETTPLVRNAQKQNASVEDADGEARSSADITLQNLQENDNQENETHLSVWDQISYGFVSVGGFIYQNSYIFTNILMMAWSIIYHSWLTFVLLLWANLLWMIPNQRKAMMRSSPFIVLYALMLLIAQYIYGINLTDEELPSRVNITGINLAQIGFTRHVEPCIPLFIKTLFLLMFWVTLRQYLKEKTEKRRESTIAGIFAPLSLTVGTVTNTNTTKRTSVFLKRAGEVFKNLLVRLWIWLLILVIFLCAISGKQMTGFRICYMALFLFFLLVFQSSSKAWVRIMYGFWLFLIFYVMTILILIYTYQFDKFVYYWEDYLNVPEHLQRDIGLEQYKTKDLFLHLLSPTMIVILTVIQVHYFHRRFITALQNRPAPHEIVSKKKALRKTTVSLNVGTEEGIQYTVAELVRLFLKKAIKTTVWFFKNFKDIFWRLLELHLIKLVYLTGFICSVSEVCVLHIIFVALCLLGVSVQTSVQTFISRFISLIVSIIILSKMIYQVSYLDHSKYNKNCTENDTVNAAEWFGFKKASDEEGGLMSLIRLYIVYMILVTLHAVVTLRQFQMRTITGIRDQPISYVLFPKITRADAEKNLNKMIKYLVNYGFYKFGLELTVIWLVADIAFRQDIIALLYTIWFVILLMLKRVRVARIWVVFGCFVGILIFLQYLLLLGPPPNLCVVYPWVGESYSKGLQRWAMLPGDAHLSHVPKLVFDFVLLMLIVRQQRVFSIESNQTKTNKIEFPGGDNKSVVADIAKLGQVSFRNPTRDFLSHVRNYLDIFQNVVLSGSYWITLGIVLVGGTNINNFLALGYLVGAFIFLWEGSDFYLRPINSILIRWRLLLAYNVANIVIKTFLQIGGCLFLTQLRYNCCWLVHMLGISCVARPLGKNVPMDHLSECAITTTSSFLYWDAICFGFLIFQLRIFKSHYFCHIILDTRANNILASRGAEIIENLRQKQIEHRQEHERAVLLKIKRKMEKIRATQQKMLRPIDKPTHFDEHGNLVRGSKLSKRREPRLHPEAVRAGDYYMFEDMDNKFELDIIEDGKDFLDEQEQLTESEKKMTRRMTLFGVWKDLSGAEYRREMYTRQRSYASAPGSHFDFHEIGDEDFPPGGGGDTSESWEGGDTAVRISTHSEPLAFIHSKSDYFHLQDRNKTKSEDSHVYKDGEDTVKPSEPEKKTAPVATDVVDEPSERTSKSLKSEVVQQAESDDEPDLTANPIARLMEGFFVSLIIRLNRFSRNYRYVNKILAEEKQALKESDNLSRMGRPGAASMFNVFRKNVQSGTNEDTVENIAGTSQNDITQITAITPTESNFPSQLQSPQDSIQEQEQQHQQQPEQIEHADHDIMEIPLDNVDGEEGGNTSTIQKARLYKMEIMPEIRVNAPSCTRSREGSITIIKRHSFELVKSPNTYAIDDAEFAARDHHIVIEVMIAMWYAILSNTDLICYIVIFVNQVWNASLTSLPLPIMVFLWGTLSLPRPTKTFWVTLIAYTQAIVLIKCIFQYKLIWAHYISLPNQPLTWAKLFAVEQRENYANMDLLVLLALFFHRFILKSHGLWKSKNSYQSEEMFTVNSCDPEEIEEWKDAQSNIETMRDMKSKDTIKGDEDTKLDEREKGGSQNVVAPHGSFKRLRSEIDRLSIAPSQASDKYLSGLRHLRRTEYLSSLRKFFYSLVHKPRLPDDVYALMFLCDFINFFVLLFGFSSFSSRQTEHDDGGVQAYLSDNNVPVPFLIMLLVQFLLIVVDRALYLRKALVPKIIFHFLSVIGVHVWMFFIVPFVTESSFYKLTPPIIFYIFKCFYMLLSSYQIKCGYPRRILGNFLTKGFSIVNMISFKLFLAMPFLYELRTVLDWLCTDTTMTMFDWLKMEDIFSDVFVIRCTRQMEQDFPAIRAQKKAVYLKLLLGGTIILAIVILIWGPLCLFALGRTVGESNVPYEVTVTMRIGSYDPVYHTNNRESIFTFNGEMLHNMTNAYGQDREAIPFLSEYDASDIAAIKLPGNSPSLWTISPPDKERLVNDLQTGKTLKARFMYTLTRVPPAKEISSSVNKEIIVDLDEKFEGRQAFIKMIKGESAGEVVTIPDLIPKFLKVQNSGNVGIANLLSPGFDPYRNLKLKMHSSSGNVWWEIRDDCSDEFYDTILKSLPYPSCDSGITMYVFNEKKFPSTLGWLSATGIFGLYTTFVLVASRFLKSFMSGQNRKIMFEDLPYVDRVLQLCLDIYLVREALEFALEEDLFAKLIFLYRSPETLIKWTRPKEELNDDGTDSESLPSRSSIRRFTERGTNEQQQQQQQQ